MDSPLSTMKQRMTCHSISILVPSSSSVLCYRNIPDNADADNVFVNCIFVHHIKDSHLSVCVGVCIVILFSTVFPGVGKHCNNMVSPICKLIKQTGTNFA